LDAALWSAALIDVLLPPREEGGSVLLACHDGVVAEAAAALGVKDDHPVGALARAVLAAGGLPAAAESARRFADLPRPRPVPEHTAALALLVIAASHMGEPDGIATQAYYRRLGTLIGPPDRRANPPYQGFGELCDVGFPVLADWLADDQHGARGELWLNPKPAPRWVGHPVSQAALRAADRYRLEAFFAQRARELEAGWDPAGSLLHDPIRHRLTKPARALLRDPARRKLLSTALGVARDSWRAGRNEPDAETAAPLRRLQTTLLADLDPTGRRLRLALRVEGLDGSQAAVGPDGGELVVPAAPATLEIPLIWLAHAVEGPATMRLADGRRVTLLPGPVVLFQAGPLGLQQAVGPDADIAWALTCVDTIDGDPIPATLPGRWRLLTDVDAKTLPATRAPAVRTPPSKLQVVSGLPLGDGVWFAGAPLTIGAPLGTVDDLLLEGRPVGRLDHLTSTVRVDLSGHEGMVAFEAAGLRLDVVVARRGTREGHGGLRWRLDDPVHAAVGPSGEHGDDVAPTLAGALLAGDAAADAEPARGPWCRLRGTVWALHADGTHQVVRSPAPEPWQLALGYGPGSRWQLPAGTVWACQPQRGLVELVDPHADGPAPSAELADAVARCAGARVVGPRAAHARWQRVLASLETFQHA